MRGWLRQVGWGQVEVGGVAGVDVWVIVEILSRGIIGDVVELVVKVIHTSDAVSVVAVLPDLS
jgi:hypothetical protein